MLSTTFKMCLKNFGMPFECISLLNEFDFPIISSSVEFFLEDRINKNEGNTITMKTL